MKKCHNYKCLKDLEIKTPVGRKDVCPSCGSDLRCCLNCVFHAPGAYNECKEPPRLIHHGIIDQIVVQMVRQGRSCPAIIWIPSGRSHALSIPSPP